MRWQRKSCGYDMGNIKDIIANTSNISNILSNVQFPPSHVNRISSGERRDLFGAFWSYGSPVLPQGNYQKRTGQADELLFFPFVFEGMNMIEHHKIHVRVDVCWCHVWTVQAYVCAFKDIDFMFYVWIYNIYLISYCILFWCAPLLNNDDHGYVMMVMMMVVVVMMNPFGKYICVDIVFLEDPDGASPTQKWHLLSYPPVC